MGGQLPDNHNRALTKRPRFHDFPAGQPDSQRKMLSAKYSVVCRHDNGGSYSGKRCAPGEVDHRNAPVESFNDGKIREVVGTIGNQPEGRARISAKNRSVRKAVSLSSAA